MPPSPSGSSPSLSGCCDLLCREDAGELCVLEDDSGECIAGFVEGEAAVDFAGCEDPGRFRSDSLDPTARRDAVAWILKVRSYYRFRPLTAYLAVDYMDRFLCSHRLPQNGWALQLLSVACLSLAAKMEETLVPSLLDLQVEDATFIFEPRTVLRMELLVLTALDWRLQAMTPFSFVNFFAYKVDPLSKRARLLVSKATQIILATMHEVDFPSHCPSALAAAAIICAANETQNPAFVNPSTAASWCVGLTEERIAKCYQMMQQVYADRILRKTPMILSQHRVTSPVKREPRISSSSPSPSSKRRKLNNHNCN
ncbi:cyclin-D1-2-like [Canna indica]|uniref:Cyclin-D1-2-like n=1 Tax=Canna indica TaxID=4628 RepID=A0AAQ3Q020_9LILI|nr:cyclin-D1-2-like [Canna indica]